jgi:hypothetical protein
LNTYEVVKYIHLLFLLGAFGAAAVVWACLFNLRAAKTLADAAPWGALAGKLESTFPVAILGLFGSGAYMTTDAWTWSTRWIDVSIAGLALMFVQGGGVAARRAHALKHALMANGPGPLGEPARRMARDVALWVVAFANPTVALGIVWNMTQKPGVAGAIGAIVGGYAVGVALAFRLTRSRADALAAVTETS